MMLMPPEDFHGHINLVHCISYGEGWLLDQSKFSKLSRGEQQSVSCGTNQFWRVLSVLAGDCAEHTTGNDGLIVYDTLDNENFKHAFVHVIGSDKCDKSKMCCLVAGKVRIQMILWQKKIVLADVCPVPIYSGIGNPAKRMNKVTGKFYTDRQKKFTEKESQLILKTC